MTYRLPEDMRTKNHALCAASLANREHVNDEWTWTFFTQIRGVNNNSELLLFRPRRRDIDAINPFYTINNKYIQQVYSRSGVPCRSLKSTSDDRSNEEYAWEFPAVQKSDRSQH